MLAIKKALVKTRLPVKFLYSNTTSWQSATTTDINFRDYTAQAIAGHDVLLQLKSALITCEKIAPDMFIEDEWQLLVRLYEWDETQNQRSKKYKTMACPRYQIWDVLQTSHLAHETAVLIFKCCQSANKLRKRTNPKRTVQQKPAVFQSARKGQSAMKKMCNEENREQKALKVFHDKIQSDPNYIDVKQAVERTPALCTWVMNKARFANGGYTVGDAIRDIRARLKHTSTSSVKNIPRNQSATQIDNKLLQNLVNSNTAMATEQSSNTKPLIFKVTDRAAPPLNNTLSRGHYAGHAQSENEPQTAVYPKHIKTEYKVDEDQNELRFNAISEELARLESSNMHLQEELDRAHSDIAMLESGTTFLRRKMDQMTQFTTVLAVSALALSDGKDDIRNKIILAIKQHGDMRLINKIKQIPQSNAPLLNRSADISHWSCSCGYDNIDGNNTCCNCDAKKPDSDLEIIRDDDGDDDDETQKMNDNDNDNDIDVADINVEIQQDNITGVVSVIGKTSPAAVLCESYDLTGDVRGTYDRIKHARNKDIISGKIPAVGKNQKVKMEKGSREKSGEHIIASLPKLERDSNPIKRQLIKRTHQKTNIKHSQ